MPRLIRVATVDVDGDGSAREGGCHRRQPLDGRAVAELSETVIAPAQDGAGGPQRAGLVIAAFDGDRIRDAGNEGRNQPIDSGPITALARRVRAPAGDSPIGFDGAGVVPAHRDAHRASVFLGVLTATADARIDRARIAIIALGVGGAAETRVEGQTGVEADDHILCGDGA